jgi:hypothetical protein
MRLRGTFHIVVGFMFLAMLLAVQPAWADQELDAQIKALEKEVAKIEPLKDQLEKLKEQQIELKKEATAAAAELPTFQYRPGRGLTIAAADKSWSLNTTYRINMYIYNTIHGKPNFFANGEQRQSGTTYGEIFPRRNRLYMNYCWHDCFYAFEYSIDGETAERQASVRDNELYFHFDQWNPYLPYFSVGLRRGAGRTHVSRSSDNDGKMEHSIILDGFAWGGDGSHAGAGLGWEGVDVGPGELDLFLNFASSRQGTHQEFVNDNRKGIMAFIGGRPFANLKNKWISGIDIGFGYQGHALDRPENSLDDTGGTEIRVRSVERRGRQDLFRPGALGQDTVNCNDDDVCSSQNVGAGWGHVFIPGMKWQIGPYMFRAVWLKTQYKNRNTDSTDELRGAGMWGKGWTIDHQLMLWSPKGFLTGSQTTPHTLMASFGFERAEMDCGRGCDASPGAGSFHHQTVLNREAALWYWIQPSLGIGMWWHWWTSANTPVRTQVAVGCKDDISSADSGKGAGRKCDWHSVNTGLRFRW